MSFDWMIEVLGVFKWRLLTRRYYVFIQLWDDFGEFNDLKRKLKNKT